jgi:polyisoprenoid-binding protein YceI
MTFTKNMLQLKVSLLCFLALTVLPSISQAQAPVFTVTPNQSSVKFYVKASVSLVGRFDKWDATLTFPSSDVTTGVLEIKIQAASVNTGSEIKNSKLKSGDFFNVEKDPLITFLSKKVTQTGPDTFDVQGDFTIRGVTKTEILKLKLYGKGTGSGVINGVMAFNRKDFGMDKGIPFIKIDDRVEVTVNLKVKKVSGPPMVYKQ